jgi:hypothetical protein
MNIPPSIDPPYLDMLVSLSTVEGYDEYIQWLGNRSLDDLSWRSEIKGLFEIHKREHPLLRIGSHHPSDPEGFFRAYDNDTEGFIECAYIQYLFSAHSGKKRCENIAKNLFVSVQRFLTLDDEALIILIKSFRQPPTEEDKKTVIEVLRQRKRPNELFEVEFGYFGHFERTPSLSDIGLLMSDESMALIVSSRGVSVGAYNITLDEKIQRLLSTKRKQHEDIRPGRFALYYFFIDGPPSILGKINTTKLQGCLRQNEAVVCCAVGVKQGKYFEEKILLTNGHPNVDLSNVYFL